MALHLGAWAGLSAYAVVATVVPSAWLLLTAATTVWAVLSVAAVLALLEHVTVGRRPRPWFQTISSVVLVATLFVVPGWTGMV